MAKSQRPRRARAPIAAIIRTNAGKEFNIPGGKYLQEMAVRWAYLVRNRNHWNKTKYALMRTNLQQQVRRFGYDPTELREIASSRLIEVEIPFREESIGWEARVLPW